MLASRPQAGRGPVHMDSKHARVAKSKASRAWTCSAGGVTLLLYRTRPKEAHSRNKSRAVCGRAGQACSSGLLAATRLDKV